MALPRTDDAIRKWARRIVQQRIFADLVRNGLPEPTRGPGLQFVQLTDWQTSHFLEVTDGLCGEPW